MSPRRLAKRALPLLGALGAYRLIHAAARRSPKIFMYHRFSAENAPRKLSIPRFEEHVQLLAREFNVITMGDLVRHVRAHGEAPPHCAVITVDDGHRDFVELAVPVLERYGLPATLYVTTRFVEGGFWLWPDRLEYALFETQAPRLDLGDLGSWTLQGECDRWAAWNAIIRHCTSIAHNDKQALLEEVERALGVDVPEEPVAGYSAVSVPELQALARGGFEIGAHTVSHPILSRLPESELEGEIRGSKDRIEQWLQTEVPSFCYPNGMKEDFDEPVKACVRAAGFASAVAAYFHHDVLGDLYEIKRYSGAADPVAFKHNAYGVERFSSYVRDRFAV